MRSPGQCSSAAHPARAPPAVPCVTCPVPEFHRQPKRRRRDTSGLPEATAGCLLVFELMRHWQVLAPFRVRTADAERVSHTPAQIQIAEKKISAAVFRVTYIAKTRVRRSRATRRGSTRGYIRAPNSKTDAAGRPLPVPAEACTCARAFIRTSMPVSSFKVKPTQ
jgi:hypothetical protein